MKLELLLAGLLAGSQPASAMQLQYFVNQYKQDQQDYSEILEQKLQDPGLSEKDRQLYINTHTILSKATRAEVEREGGIFASYHPTVKIHGQEIPLHIQFFYECGPRGGAGTLIAKIWLDETAWYSLIGIESFILSFFSVHETKMSTKMYEVNVNHYRGCATYMPLKERMLESSYIYAKTKGALAAVLKKLGIDKKDLKKFRIITGIIEDIQDYQRRQLVTQIGNLIAENHVCTKDYRYDGYGSVEVGGGLRAPKLVKLKIKRGEASIVAFAFQGVIRYYDEMSFGKKELGLKRRRQHIKLFGAPLDVSTAAKSMGARPESSEDEEEEEGNDE